MTDQSTVNVQEYGARGDGQADDTGAIRAAIAALPVKGGVLFFPPGHYLTDTLYPPNFTTFLGHSAFGYQESGGTVISPFKPLQPRLVDLNGRKGVRLTGLTFHGRDMGEEMAGIYAARGTEHEQHIVVDSCKIEHFSGCGLAMSESHVWCLRHSIFCCNRLDGADASNSFDGWITDCMFVANGRYGLSLGNSTTVNGCRIEHNGCAGLTVNRYYGQHLQINGNLFCSEKGPAIEILEGNVRAIAITGNTIRISARGVLDNPDRDCHVRVEGVQGLVFTGNALHILWANTPSYGMVLRGLKDSIVANNSLFKGAMKELIRDLGGHTNTVIENNPGSLKDPKDTDS
ncbi:MAG: glycosyl hydrolase family 28-related protein [bacterium]